MSNNISFIDIPKNAGSSIKEISQSVGLNYCFHDIDPSTVKTNQLIILRDPVSRFCSAINYSLNTYNEYKSEKQINDILNADVNTPNSFATAFFDSNHPYHNLVLAEMTNIKHFIGSHKLTFKWTYTPQHLWVINPTYVLIYDNLHEELKYFMNNILGLKETIKLPEINVSNGDCNLSIENIKHIQNYYRMDLELYTYYKIRPIFERLK